MNGTKQKLDHREGSTRSQKLEIFHDFCHEASDPPTSNGTFFYPFFTLFLSFTITIKPYIYDKNLTLRPTQRCNLKSWKKS